MTYTQKIANMERVSRKSLGTVAISCVGKMQLINGMKLDVGYGGGYCGGRLEC